MTRLEEAIAEFENQNSQEEYCIKLEVATSTRAK